MAGIAMTVTDTQVAALRAHLIGDYGAYDRLCGGSDQVNAQPGFSMLLAAVFTLAIRHRFGTAHANTDIVRFVAAVRSKYEDATGEIDPRSAENLIRVALGDFPGADDLDESAKALQIPLLNELITDERLEDSKLDALLASARRLADST